MHPILFRFGSIIIYTYTILLEVGLVCGLGLACLEGKRRGVAPERIVDAALWAVVAGIVGGRVGYVLANQEYFAENFGEAFYIWEGGLAFQGAFLAGLLALFLYSAYHKLPSLALADTAALGLALGQVFGWLGCLMSGCAYGLESHGATFLARLSLDLPDIYGILILLTRGRRSSPAPILLDPNTTSNTSRSLTLSWINSKSTLRSMGK